MSRPEIAFVADDFTGACDTLATLARGGLRTRLFTHCPETFPDDLDAIGVATALRAMAPAEGREVLQKIAPRIASVDARVTHFKVCSTFDSAPETGNIGAVSDVLAAALAADWVAIVGGQPSLGRYCLFGTLFAAAGDGTVHRIDRHPVMKAHPTTPMSEADLRRLLGLQGWPEIGLVDYQSYGDAADLRTSLAARLNDGERRTLFDVAADGDLAVIGRAIRDRSEGQRVLCVGASSVAEAMLASAEQKSVSALRSGDACFDGPVLAISGSRSAVTQAQIDTAQAYEKMPAAAIDFFPGTSSRAALVKRCVRALRSGANVLIVVSEDRHRDVSASRLSWMLAGFAAEIAGLAPPGCLTVAGGDTSSAVVSALDVASLEFVQDVDRGVPLVKASKAGLSDGLAMVLKGGQMGKAGLFDSIARLRI